MYERWLEVANEEKGKTKCLCGVFGGKEMLEPLKGGKDQFRT